MKRGGVLNVVRHEISLRCPADRIPDSIEIDLTGTEIGDSIHISSVTLPEGAVPTISDRDFTVATIVGRGAEDSARATGAGEEGEEQAAGEESKE